MSLPFRYKDLPEKYDAREIEAILQEMLTTLNSGYKYVQLQQQNTAFDRTSAGMLVLIDGTNWNPGSGHGIYLRSAANSAWTRLVEVPDLAVYQPLDATLTALSAADWVANSIPVGSGANTLSQVALAANTFIARSSAGNAVAKTITDFGLSLVDDASDSAARTTLGVAIGSDVQAFSSNLSSLAALSYANNNVVVGSAGSPGVLTIAPGTFPGRSSAGTTAAKVMSDDAFAFNAAANNAAMRTALGLGTMATAATTDYAALAGATFTGLVKHTSVLAPQISNGAPAAKAAGSTLTGAEVLTGWCNYTGAASTLTLPTGTNMDTAAGTPATDTRWDFNVINTGSGTATVTAAAGFTIAATATVASGRTARFLVRKTAANTYILCGA